MSTGNLRSLEQRFHEFLEQLDGSESIDKSVSEHELAAGKRADFLLDQRRVIVEIKSLESDPEYKVEELLAPHRNRPDFPAFYWDADLDEILPFLPDGREIRLKIADAVTRSVEKALKKADDQIYATRQALSLPQACGVAVILNEEINILAPHIVTARASKLLLKKEGADFRYQQISYVWIISESHAVTISGSTQFLPLILLAGPRAQDNDQAGEYINGLAKQWAEFVGVPLSSYGDINSFDGFKFETRHCEVQESSDPPERHEVWRRSYRQNPYLRALTEDEFLKHGTNIMVAMAPNFLIGGRGLPNHKVAVLMELFTHVLEEAEYRRLDMRKLQARLPDLSTLIS